MLLCPHLLLCRSSGVVDLLRPFVNHVFNLGTTVDAQAESMFRQVVELSMELSSIQRLARNLAHNVMEDAFVVPVHGVEAIAAFGMRAANAPLVALQIKHLVWIPLMVKCRKRGLANGTMGVDGRHCECSAVCVWGSLSVVQAVYDGGSAGKDIHEVCTSITYPPRFPLGAEPWPRSPTRS